MEQFHHLSEMVRQDGHMLFNQWLKKDYPSVRWVGTVDNYPAGQLTGNPEYINWLLLKL